MNLILSLIPLLVLLTIVPAIYSAFIQLSARLLRYQGITWKQGFVFGIIVLISSILINISANLIEYSLSITITYIIGVLVNLLLGGWFFSKREGIDAEGGPLGWAGAMKLTGLAFIMFSITGAVVTRVLKILTT